MRAVSEEHKEAFEAITSGEYDNFVLVSTELDGIETSAIATLHHVNGEVEITPLAVMVTPDIYDKLATPDKDLP